jgi:hypothetical protein
MAGGHMNTLFYFCLTVIGSLVLAATVSAGNKQIVGWVEKARISPGNLVLKAKMDSGADNSSLNVPNVDEFERKGEKWVRFELVNEQGQSVVIERRLVRLARIKRHRGMRQERPVVRMGICVGNYYREAEVNLVDRSRFKYPLLIGRSFMGDNLVIDPSAQFTLEPGCGEQPSVE